MANELGASPAIMETRRLCQRIATCQECAEQLPLPPKPIYQFDPAAKILLIGQAPGRAAHDANQPFADVSGERLRDWLGMIDDDFYNPKLLAIVPMALCYPGRGNSGDKPPPKICAERWQQPLRDQLTQCQLTLYVGRYAQQYYLDKSLSMTQQLQQWRRYWPDAVPLPHPSPRNQPWIKRHGSFQTELLPHLRQRIADIIRT